MRIYIAGPMTGLPDFNRPAFNAAAAALRDVGINVCNPAEIKEKPDASWKDYMREGIDQLMFCDGIFMLEGWEKSKGAKLERHIAGELGLPISFQKKKEPIFGAGSGIPKDLKDSPEVTDALKKAKDSMEKGSFIATLRHLEIEAKAKKEKEERKAAKAEKISDEDEARIRRIASLLGMGKICDCGDPDCPMSGLDVQIFRL